MIDLCVLEVQSKCFNLGKCHLEIFAGRVSAPELECSEVSKLDGCAGRVAATCSGSDTGSIVNLYHCDYLTIRALQGWCRSVLDMDIDVMVLGWDVDLETSKIDI